MSDIVQKLIQAIDQRRHDLAIEAQSLSKTWFDRETSSNGEERRKTRYYVPRVRVDAADDGTVRSVRLTWQRRYPVNGWHGRASKKQTDRTVKVMLSHIKARKKGPAYPMTSFPDATGHERDDIERLEALLAPIRDELKKLGKAKWLIGKLFGVRYEPESDDDNEPEDDLVSMVDGMDQPFEPPKDAPF